MNLKKKKACGTFVTFSREYTCKYIVVCALCNCAFRAVHKNEEINKSQRFFRLMKLQKIS